MSRVHEALTRAAESKEAPPVSSTISSYEGAFKSAWPAVSVEERASTTDRNDERSETLLVSQRSVNIKGFSSQWRARLASTPDGNPTLIEQFRRLAGTLHHAQAASQIRVIMVTSATPDDGKTLTAINLALVLSDSYKRRVLLVDADLRRPSIPDVVDLSDGVGLSENLRARTEQKLALVQLSPTLTLLPAGQPIPDPIEALTSPRMRHILEEASARFDWVILDAPPVGQSADASLLTDMVHGTLFVIRSGHTQYPHVMKALEAIGRQRILGVVFNGVEEMPDRQDERYAAASNLARQARKSAER